MEAGIPHRHMTLSLQRFIEPRVTPPPPDVSEEQRQRVTSIALTHSERRH